MFFRLTPILLVAGDMWHFLAFNVTEGSATAELNFTSGIEFIDLISFVFVDSDAMMVIA